jgi:hypothetical protein
VSGRQADYVEYVEARLAWLRRLAYLLCQDWHSADDLVQATVTRLFTHWPRASRMDNTDAYVRRILVRTFLSERRSPWFRRVLLSGVQADRAAVYADSGRRAGRPRGARHDPAASAGHARAVVQTLKLDDYQGKVGNFAVTDVDQVQIFAAPAAHSAFSCPQGTGQHVTVDGATAVLENSTAQGRDQQLCISDSDGLRVLVWLIARANAPAPNPAGPHGVLAYARLLHLLGPDVAQWTANLLR